MNKECVFIGSDVLGPAGDYMQSEVTLFFSPQASASAPVKHNTIRTLCTADGEPFVLPRGAVLARIVAVPAPYETRTKHMPEASGALLAALGNARIQVTRHEVESTSPFTLGAPMPIRVHSPEDAVAGGSDTTGWLSNECEIRVGPAHLSTGQALAVFGGYDREKGVSNPAGAAETGFTTGQTIYAHGQTEAANKAFVALPTALRGTYIDAGGTAPLVADVSITLTYRLKLTTFSVTEYMPFPPKLV
jgi:hypothetical protein